MFAVVAMARMKKAYPKIHGEKKRQFQFMLTEGASEELDKVAQQLGISRSEVLERVIRSGVSEIVVAFNSELQTV